jgi:hypothetical protein
MASNRMHRYLLLGLMLLIAGCTIPPTTYNPYFVPDKSIKEIDQIAGNVFIYTTPSSDDKELVFPKSKTVAAGGVPPMTIPIGKITRGVALKVFKRVATAGADAGNSLPPDKQYAVIIRPETTKFTHGYKSLKYLGMALEPQSEIDLVVTLLDSKGCTRSEFFYASGPVSGPPSSYGPVQDLNRLLHETLYKLYLQAAADIKKDLLAAKPPSSASPCVTTPATIS